MRAKECINCGSDDINTDDEQVLYVVESGSEQGVITTLTVYWCNTCKCKFVW